MIPFLDLKYLVNEKSNIMAVDIGNEGGYCFNGNGIDIRITPIPECLRKQFEILGFPDPDFIIAENVHTMPGQGVVSQGTLLKNRGRLEGMAAAINCVIRWIEPSVWQRCFTIKRKKHFENTRAWKRHLIEQALEILPEEYHHLINLKTCDAFLIWYYAAHIEVARPLSDKGQLTFL